MLERAGVFYKPARMASLWGAVMIKHARVSTVRCWLGLRTALLPNLRGFKNFRRAGNPQAAAARSFGTLPSPLPTRQQGDANGQTVPVCSVNKFNTGICRHTHTYAAVCTNRGAHRPRSLASGLFLFKRISSSSRNIHHIHHIRCHLHQRPTTTISIGQLHSRLVAPTTPQNCSPRGYHSITSSSLSSTTTASASASLHTDATMADREILPDNFRPQHYDLVLTDLNFAEWTYKGTVMYVVLPFQLVAAAPPPPPIPPLSISV